ncbi:MAG: methyltransferase domain-containing protein, partial [Crocosphaera sp.]
YYTIELEKNKFTQGKKHGNLALTKLLLNSIKLSNVSCLDIGTQEAIVPVIMKQLGASEVVAYDRLDLSERIKAVKYSYQVDFDYLCGFQLNDLPVNLQKLNKFRNKLAIFDFVNFSGIFYHMINPLGLLGLARGFCRVGGLFLIETAAIQSQEPLMYFNMKGELYGLFSNYFIPTTNLLDYFLRMIRLEPLSFAYIGNHKDSSKIIRLAVLCKSLNETASLFPDDRWINSD